MSALVGADIAGLRTLAADFVSQAARLDAVDSRLTGRIHSAPWRGHDVERFTSDWDYRYRSQLRTTATSLRTMSVKLRDEADQQERASAADTGSSPAMAAVLRAGEQRRLAESDPSRLAQFADSVIGFNNNLSTALLALDSVREVATIAAFYAEKLGPNYWSKAGQEALELAEDSSRTLKVLGTMGKVLPWISLGSDSFELGEKLAEGKWADVAWSAGSVAFSAASILLVGNPVGLAIVGTAGVAYGITKFLAQNPEVRAKIGEYAQAAGGAVVDAGQAVWSGVSAAAGNVQAVAGAARDAAVQAGGAVVDAASQAAGAVRQSAQNFVSNVFRRPSWAR